MSNRGYEAADSAEPSRPDRLENQAEDGKRSHRKGKRLRVRRKAFSGRELDMQQLKKIVDQAPEIRADRVAAAKQALQAGTLELRGEELAEKLLRDFLHKGNAEA
jgi:anti-sigma28 factor (negative regulator of flagellin synthesis)